MPSTHRGDRTPVAFRSRPSIASLRCIKQRSTSSARGVGRDELRPARAADSSFDSGPADREALRARAGFVQLPSDGSAIRAGWAAAAALGRRPGETVDLRPPGCLAHANGLLRVAKCGFQPMDEGRSGCQLQRNRERMDYEPTIIFAIEQGTAKRGVVALQSGHVHIGRAP